MTLEFTIYAKAEPQGSTKAFVVAGKARTTSANPKMKPFRSEVTRCAIWEMADQKIEMFGKHVPVKLSVVFTFRRPASMPRKRVHCVVRPDLDKLTRTIGDALTGCAWHDDSQVVEIAVRKEYGPVESVRVRVDEVIEALKGSQ